jgi:uncharacterized membrane protein
MPKTINAQQKGKANVSHRFKKYSLAIAIAVLVIFHGVGFWGLMFSGKPAYFQALTPLNLLLTNALLFSFHRSWNLSFLLFALTVFGVGFFSEVVGVHTGLLFGSYTYGSALGYKVWEVPLLIGLNWLMLVYITGHISNYTNWPFVAKAILGAALMVLLDFFIEPVAMQFDFWDWNKSIVPVSNYIGWFVIALLLQLYFQKTAFKKHNLIAPYIYLVQILFFVAIYCMLQVG